MARLNPYLLFTGNCREAMNFYQSCLGGALNVMSYGDSPGGDQMPAELRNNVLHAMLMADGITLMASDVPSGEAASQAGSVTLALSSDDKDEIRTAFAKLSAGGTVTQPLQDAFFGLFGEIVDRFGFKWMFQGGAAS